MTEIWTQAALRLGLALLNSSTHHGIASLGAGILTQEEV